MTEKLLTPDELCDLLKVSRGMLYDLVRDGLPVFKLNQRVWRFSASDVEKWISRKISSAAETPETLEEFN